MYFKLNLKLLDCRQKFSNSATLGLISIFGGRVYFTCSFWKHSAMILMCTATTIWFCANLSTCFVLIQHETSQSSSSSGKNTLELSDNERSLHLIRIMSVHSKTKRDAHLIWLVVRCECAQHVNMLRAVPVQKDVFYLKDGVIFLSRT